MDTERCELPVGQCEHTRPALARSRPDHSNVVLLSPRNVAHLTGCSHNDESNLVGWGEIRDVPRAWERIGRGEVLKATGGENLGREARSRCLDCVNR